MGLPCPNIFAGGHNFHGKYEYVPVESMQKAVEVIVKIAELTAKSKSKNQRSQNWEYFETLQKCVPWQQKSLDEYIVQSPQLGGGTKSYEIVTSTELEETVKWGGPVYTIERKECDGDWCL